MFFGGLTIATNGFSMVFDFATIAFNGFRWFRTIGQTMRWFRWIVVVYPALICFGFHNSALQDSAPRQMYFIARGNKTRTAEYIEFLTTSFCDFRLLIKS